MKPIKKKKRINYEKSNKKQHCAICNIDSTCGDIATYCITHMYGCGMANKQNKMECYPNFLYNMLHIFGLSAW